MVMVMVIIKGYSEPGTKSVIKTEKDNNYWPVQLASHAPDQWHDSILCLNCKGSNYTYYYSYTTSNPLPIQTYL